MSSKPKDVLAPPFQGYELRPLKGVFGVVIPEASANLLTETAYSTLQAGIGSVLTAAGDGHRRGVQAVQVGSGVRADNGSATLLVTLAPGCYTWSFDLKGIANAHYKLFAAQGVNELARMFVRATGQWQRDTVALTFHVETAGEVALQVALSGMYASFDGWHIAGVQLEMLDHATTFMGPGVASWWPGNAGLVEENDTWSRLGWSRAGGRLERIKEMGMRVSGFRGLGLPPIQHVTSPYTLRVGSEHQRSRFRHREFGITGQFTTESMEELHRLVGHVERSLIGLRTYDENPMILRFQHVDDSGCLVGREVEIICRYVTGLEGRISSDFGSVYEVVFVTDEPFLREVGYCSEEFLLSDLEDGVLTVTNEGDAPAPVSFEFVGSGTLNKISNLSNEQEIEFTTPVALDTNALRLLPEAVNIQQKVARWNPASNAYLSSELVKLKAGGHLPIAELLPSRRGASGVNRIQLTGSNLAGVVRVTWQQRWLSVSGAALGLGE